MHTHRGSKERLEKVAEGKVLFIDKYKHIWFDTGTKGINTRMKIHHETTKTIDKLIGEGSGIDLVHEEVAFRVLAVSSREVPGLAHVRESAVSTNMCCRTAVAGTVEGSGDGGLQTSHEGKQQRKSKVEEATCCSTVRINW
jgi:hypothetical protein